MVIVILQGLMKLYPNFIMEKMNRLVDCWLTIVCLYGAFFICHAVKGPRSSHGFDSVEET